MRITTSPSSLCPDKSVARTRKERSWGSRNRLTPGRRVVAPWLSTRNHLAGVSRGAQTWQRLQRLGRQRQLLQMWCSPRRSPSRPARCRPSAEHHCVYNRDPNRKIHHGGAPWSEACKYRLYESQLPRNRTFASGFVDSDVQLAKRWHCDAIRRGELEMSVSSQSTTTNESPS